VKTKTKTATIVPIEIARCRNIFGPLNAESRSRLLAVLNKPSRETWNNTYSLIIAFGSESETLWQAVVAVDPSFPHTFTQRSTGPVGSTPSAADKKKALDGRWSRIPTRDLILRAVRHATSLPTRREVSR
jgi:hypothetical protein